jgi:hypothetical protein
MRMSSRRCSVSLSLVTLTAACQSSQYYVHVAKPEAVKADARYSATFLSHGNSGTLESNDDTFAQVPEGNRFKLPDDCDEGVHLDAEGHTSKEFESFAELHPELVDRQKWEPTLAVQISCGSTVEYGKALPLDQPERERSQHQRSLYIGSEYTLSTLPTNITELEQHSHVIANAALWTSVVASGVAAVCGVGVAATTPPPDEPYPDEELRSGFTVCALGALSVAVAGVVVAIVDPTIVNHYDVTPGEAAQGR